MKTQTYLKRVLAVFLVMVLASQVITLPVGAQEKTDPVYLEAATMPEEILSADTFYVGTTSADLQEDYAAPYLLKIGRGGDAAEKASVTLKITDATASYDKDYKVSCQGKFFTKKADNPKDNESLLDIIAENEILSETPIGDDEDQAESMQQAVEEIKEKVAAEDEEAAKEETASEIEEQPANVLRDAKEAMSGETSDRGDVTASGNDLVDVLSQTANSLTNLVQGATLQVDFAAGEAEKYVEIATIDNDESDGDRIFYVTLAEPSEGYTNSMVSESMFTITDDEPLQNAVISFEKASYTTKGGKLTVVVKREGAISQTVSVTMQTQSGTARSGVEYSPVDAQVTFPFGVTERRLEIQTDNSHISGSLDFSLVLLPGTGTEIGEIGRATVNVQAENYGRASAVTGAAAKRAEAPTAGAKTGGDVTAQTVRSLEDVIYENDGSWFWMTAHEDQTFFSRWGDGFSRAVCMNGNWYVRLGVKSGNEDIRIHLAGSRSWNHTDTGAQYVYNGATWRMDSNQAKDSCPVHVQLEGGYSGYPDWTDLWQTNTGDIPGNPGMEVTRYFNRGEIRRVRFFAGTKSGNGEFYGDIRYFKNILRPFVFKVQNPETTSFYDGTSSVRTPAATQPETKLSCLDSGDVLEVVGVQGDHVFLKHKNPSESKVQLKGVRMYVNADKWVTIDPSFYIFDGQQIDITITNDFIRTYKDYVSFSKLADDGRLKGEVKLQPIYDYIDCAVTVMPNELTVDIDDESVQFFTGTLQINGEPIDVGQPRYSHNVTLHYHYGDVLRFTTDVVSDNYVASGVHLKFPSKIEQIGYYDDTRAYNNDTTSLELAEKWYELYPVYSEKNNRITIKIHEDDLKYFEQPESDDSTEFDASKYLLSAENLQKAERTGKFYLITAVDTYYIGDDGNEKELKSGDVFQFAVTAKPGYRPVWKEMNNANYYMDESFTYTTGQNRALNVLRLYAGKESSDYVSIKCRLFYEPLVLKTGLTANEPILIARDGFFAITGQIAIPDENGYAQTSAFHPVQSITLAGETRTFGDGADQLDLCTRATFSASNSTQTRDIKLNMTGATQKVSDGETLRDAKVTDLQNQIIDVNGANGPRITSIYTTNRGSTDSDVRMNDESTKITVTVSNIPPEGIKEVNFLILNGRTLDEKTSIRATRGEVYDDASADYSIIKTFKSDGSESDEYDQGDMIYVQIITKENPFNEEVDEEFCITTYAPMYTGYMLSISGAFAEPTVQAMNLGTVEGLSGLPFVGNFNAGLNLGPVSLSVTDIYDDQQHVVGQRIQVGMELDFEKTSISSANSDVADDGNEYGSFLNKITHLKESFKKSAKAFSDIRSAAKKAGNYKDAVKNVASMGSPKWGIVPIVGFYLDFAYREIVQQDSGQVLSRKLICNGGGIYLGVKGSFSVTWYALVPVVFIPCYFGVAGELTIAFHAGAATTATSTGESPVDFDSFVTTSHSLSETLHFDFDAGLAAEIEVYCGIGICGTLGVRGEVIFDFDFVWYPMLAKYNDYFKPIGFRPSVSIGLTIDLLLFSIPYRYELWGKDYGLLEQLSELQEMAKKNVTTQSVNGGAAASGVQYEVKPRDNTPSAWTGSVQAVSPGDVSSMATYKLKSVSTLLSDGYDRPDAQLMEMGENGTLMVFLQDDKSRTDTERTALSYSVLQDGVYSEPIIIQTDATADFQPNVADAGDNVVITWISSDPAVDKGNALDDSYEANYLKAQEVYSVSVPKADLAAHKAIDQSAIVRLTNDEFYDAQPYAVYDRTSGDYNVYYIKTAEDTESTAEAVDLANPMNTSGKTYSVIAYRVYENGKGWVTTEYKEKEKPSTVTDEQYTAQLAALGGQRLLSSPIRDEDVNKEDPLISDFHAIGYNGIGVFAYTIDKDMNAETDEDRDLFIQLYDFATRSTYVPIRITDDDLPDAMPQLVRNGSDEDGTTYLFWMSENSLHYIDISSLVKYGVDEDGQILESAIESDKDGNDSLGMSDDEFDSLTEEEQNKAAYRFRVNQVTPYADGDNNTHSSFCDYQVAVDNDDNLYVIWIQKSSTATDSPNQEVYAAAMIKTEIKSGTGDGVTGKTWSSANQLTDCGMYCDEPALAITQDNQMVMVFNRFDMAEDKTSFTDMTLCAGVFEPYCSIEATEISYSDDTPVAGQDVEVSITFKNTGLTASRNGFTADIYEKSADGVTTLLKSYDYDRSIVPTDMAMYAFKYTATESTPGSSIYVSVKEKDVQGVNNTDGVPFRLSPDYQISANRSYQGADGVFYTDVTVTNTGNEKSRETDVLELVFNGRYGSSENYGVKKTLLGSEKLSLKPGESASFTIPLDVPTAAFTKYGFIDVLTKVTDGEEEYDHQNDSVYMHQPAALTLNDGKDVEMTQGDTIDLTLDYTTSDFLNAVSPMFTTADSSVVRVEGGKLVAVGGGTTTVTAYAYPYNSAASITVTVKGTSPVIDDEEELTPLQAFFAKIKAFFEKFCLFLKQHFGTLFNMIKGWLRKIWEFLCRLVGVKVNAN